VDGEGEETPSSTTVLIPHARLGRDPDLRRVGADGRPKCDVWIAVDHWSGGEKGTEWYAVTAWAHLGELVAELARKGSEVCISGHLRSNRWEAKDGTQRRSLEIVADEVRFLSPRSASAEGQSAALSSARGRREVA
jgi:single-strand DNA-binding protein